MILKGRLFSKDSSTFKKYIESTTAHGVARIFTGKSIIRRIFWLIIVLTAAGGCLYNISDRIQFLISRPTSTTVSITRSTTLTFPAVTVCNLNNFRIMELTKRNLTELIQSALFLVSEGTNTCEEELESVSQSENLNVNITYEELSQQARYRVEDFILGCYFAGEQCNVTEMFEPTLTNLGICYTFNSGKIKPPIQSRGTGQRQGLQLVINVDQEDYSTPLDAGVKIAIHAQSEPPLPDDQGIGVPTGRNAFISIKQQNIEDQTGHNCNTDVSNLNFLQGEYPTYSEAACLVDCIYTSMADNCSCVGARSFYSPDNPRYSQLPNCTLEKVCCIVNELASPKECNCPAACSSRLYETSVSYSYFPAEYISQVFAILFGAPVDFFPTNLLGVGVYFETLNIETQTTTSAYSFVALLSDIGGQLGLFLGVSVISIMEFGTWVVDEIKNRVFGISEGSMKDRCCSRYQQKPQLPSNSAVSTEFETAYKKEMTNIT